MTTKSGKPAKALNTAEKSSFVDGQVMAELFSKIKEKENIEDNLKIKVDKTPKKILNSNTTDFADQMRYFRNLKGYSQRQVGEKIGVSEDTYRRYELNEIEVTDIKKIKKIIKVLDFSEKPILSDYVEFLMSGPDKILVNFFKKSGISKNDLREKQELIEGAYYHGLIKKKQYQRNVITK